MSIRTCRNDEAVLVSPAYLREIRACYEAQWWYAATFGSGETPLATVLRAVVQAKDGPQWVEWYAAREYLPAPALAAYTATVAPARAAYVEVERRAQETYAGAEQRAGAAEEAAVRSSQEAYDVARRRAREAYRTAARQNQDVYDAAVRPAREAYDAAVLRAAIAAADALDGKETRQ